MSRSLRSLAFALGLAVLLPASGAQGFTLALEGIQPFGATFFGCGLEILGSSNLVTVSPPAPGLAVQGGPSEFLIDGNDSVYFEFLAGSATRVRYTVSEIVASGGAVIEAFDPALVSLGTVEVSQAGEKDVSALFGGVPLGAFRVSNSVGGHRIESISFDPPGGAVSIELRNVPDEQQPTIEYCDIGFTGSDDLYVSMATGLGVRSGPTDLEFFVEPGESVTMEFDDPVIGVEYWYTSSTASVPLVRVTGYGVTGAALGQVDVANAGSVDVAALFAGAPLTGFTVEPLTGDLALHELVVVPEPGAAVLGTGALASLLALRRRRRR